jgi:hypothetical protein
MWRGGEIGPRDNRCIQYSPEVFVDENGFGIGRAEANEQCRGDTFTGGWPSV